MTRNRIAWAGAWNREHNNIRYAALLPRLPSVDRYYIDMHPWWPVRGLRRRVELPLLAIALGLTYPLMFCTDWRQIRLLRAPCVIDHDDPIYAPDELAALARRNVALIVVTTEAVRSRLQAAGIQKPIRIIPQGIIMPQVDPARVQALRTQWTRDPNEIVVGIHQPHFEFSDELGGEALRQMYAVDDLLAVMEQARALDSRLALWLVGNPSPRVAEYARQNPWVRLVGYHARNELMEYVSAFDLGVYPRRMDVGGRSSIKVIEYMACGVPVVGFDVDEMQVAMDAQAGAVAQEPQRLAQTITDFARDAERRRLLGENGRRMSGQYNWDVLAVRYSELLASAGSE
jgi:glycosyltransferase involved in cell wall biosynthesis